MRNTAFFALGLVLLLIQENFFRLLSALGALTNLVHLPWHPFQTPGLTPALVLPLVIFLGVREYSFLAGAALAFVFGYASDVLGIVPVGLYTFSMVSLFLLARALGLRLATQTQAAADAGDQRLRARQVRRDPGVPRHLRQGRLGRALGVPVRAAAHPVSTALMAPLVFAGVRVGLLAHAGALAGQVEGRGALTCRCFSCPARTSPSFANATSGSRSSRCSRS